MSCNSADLKFIPLALRLKTPHFIQFVLPSTPYSASYSWVHESFISYTVSILLSEMHSNGCRVSRTRVILERSNSSASSPKNSTQLSCRTSERRIRKSGAWFLQGKLDFCPILINKRITNFFIRIKVVDKRSIFLYLHSSIRFKRGC